MAEIIVNGGDPLPGCPENWDEARLIENKFNNGKKEGYEPLWDFDCGFKLDFDGPLMSVSGRFYPPKEHYGATWDGSVTVYILDKEYSKKQFDCKTIEELKNQVEEYVYGIANKILSHE